MKNVYSITIYIFFIIRCSESGSIYRNNKYNTNINADVKTTHTNFINNHNIVRAKCSKNYHRIDIIDRRYHNNTLNALNEEKVEIHPDALGNIERQITEKRENELRAKGIIEGDSDTWRNWHVMSQGKWEDIGYKVLPKTKGPLHITEPYALRRPLKYWGFLRGVDSNITSYPVFWEFYNDTASESISPVEGGGNPYYSPALFKPTWIMKPDRFGFDYDDVRFFEGWVGLDAKTPTRVKAACDIIQIPDTGRRYQKFYLGPYPATMGWTIGSLLKVVTQSRCPGYAIVAIKIHNMNKDTRTFGVSDDLLNIALNLKSVALETLEPGKSARVRTLIKGPSILCAGALEWPSFVRLATPETFITKLEEGAELDIELKIEWGRGFWLADLEGLHRMEEGADSICLKRRNIKEVDEEDFYPTSAVFGGCRMVRLAVHKLMGQRWCLESYTCPDPMDQLVVEIWTDASTTPKDVLQFGLSEVIAWIKELKRQITQDTDFANEDEQLKDTWEKIDKYDALKYRQKLMGGAPVVPLHKTNLFPGLKESDCNYIQPGDESTTPQSSFSLPNFPPERPSQDTLDWLARELQNEEYYDKSHINALNFEKFIDKPLEDTFENKDINELPIDKEIIDTLTMCGINRMSDIMNKSIEELSHFPNMTMEIAKIIKNYINDQLKK